MERVITWQDIKARIALLGLDPAAKYYGVPRGGQPIAAMLNPVDTPEAADVIIDDLIDSGATREKYAALYPEKPFVALFNKLTEPDIAGTWLRFPWEQTGAQDVEDNVRRVLQQFDNANREGLADTPRRYVKFLTEFLTPAPFNMTTFDSENYDEMVVVSNIPFFSLCEHHLAPFFGVGAIGYVPGGNKMVGLSKLPRVLEMFARRFQNQERITSQVADYITEHLEPKGVGVILRARHLCVEMRGVKKHNTWTTTSKMTGIFKDDLNCRQEFLNLAGKQ